MTRFVFVRPHSREVETVIKSKTGKRRDRSERDVKVKRKWVIECDLKTASAFAFSLSNCESFAKGAANFWHGFRSVFIQMSIELGDATFDFRS